MPLLDSQPIDFTTAANDKILDHQSGIVKSKSKRKVKRPTVIDNSGESLNKPGPYNPTIIGHIVSKIQNDHNIGLDSFNEVALDQIMFQESIATQESQIPQLAKSEIVASHSDTESEVPSLAEMLRTPTMRIEEEI